MKLPEPSIPEPSAADKRRADRRMREARNLDATNPHVATRLEMATRAIGLCESPIRVLMSPGLRTASGEAVPVLGKSQAYIYTVRARLDLQAQMVRPRAVMMGEALATLAEAKRLALKNGKPEEILRVLEYEAIVLGLPNPVTAARTMNVSKYERKRDAPGAPTDAELEAIIRQGEDGTGG